MRTVVGRCRADISTKRLLTRLRPGDIAVVSHADMDDVAAHAIRIRRPAAVLNVKPSYTGRYPARGPKLLVDSGIPVLDCLGEAFMGQVRDGDRLRVTGTDVWIQGRLVATGRWLGPALVSSEISAARSVLLREFSSFVDNTLKHAATERDLIPRTSRAPQLQTRVAGRPAVIVVRGRWHSDDLQSLAPYLQEQRPVLIGVDGGADALLNAGHRPDIVIGDMDSVTDRALLSARDVVVHAYADGRAPGLKRVQSLGINAAEYSCPGTSEDAALLLMFEHDAELLVGVGTHRGLVDFLDKGRPGMSSTMLVRLLVGPLLIDANGVSRLYRSQWRWSDLMVAAGAGLLPLLAVLSQGSLVAVWLRMLLLRVRMLVPW